MHTCVNRLLRWHAWPRWWWHSEECSSRSRYRRVAFTSSEISWKVAVQVRTDRIDSWGLHMSDDVSDNAKMGGSYRFHDHNVLLGDKAPSIAQSCDYHDIPAAPGRIELRGASHSILPSKPLRRVIWHFWCALRHVRSNWARSKTIDPHTLNFTTRFYSLFCHDVVPIGGENDRSISDFITKNNKNNFSELFPSTLLL
jgi:hypothetical protein